MEMKEYSSQNNIIDHEIDGDETTHRLLSMDVFTPNHRITDDKDMVLDNKPRKSKKNALIGLLLMFISGILYSFLATLVRWGSNLGYNAAEILIYRASVQVIVALILYTINCIKKNKTDKHIYSIPKKSILSTIGRGLFGAGSTFTYFQATTMIPIGDVVTLKGLTAVFTSFTGCLILKDHITLKHGFALFLSVISAILITQPPMIFKINNNFISDELPGFLIAISSSLFQCGVYICIKLAVGVPAVLLMFSQGLFSVILGLMVIIIDPKNYVFKGFNNCEWQQYICIISICFIGFISQWTLTRGGQLLIAGLASLMRATDIAWAFLWGALFFGQIPNFLTVIGGIIMFISIFIVSFDISSNSKSNS